MQTEALIAGLLPMLKELNVGDCSIALAGSRATKTDDAISDLDLYLYFEEMKPQNEICAQLLPVAEAGKDYYVSKDFMSEPYGGAINFSYCGVPVEVTAKPRDKLLRGVEQCLAGEFEIIPQTWTSNGYYSFICLSELSFVRPLWDPDGFLHTQQERIRVYPEKLRRSILSCFFERASTWIGNFHYDSAVRRGDYLFTAPIVLHTVLDMAQVLFALNRVYFTGDKRLEAALCALPYCPPLLLDNLPLLLQAAPDAAVLRKQQEILTLVHAMLREKIKE